MIQLSSVTGIAMLIAMAQFILLATVSDVAEAGSNICVGSYHTCFINKSKSLYCWGSNSSGQIGKSSTSTNIGDGAGEMKSLTTISTDADEVTCGTDHTCFLSSGSVYCFGSNTNGQLGLGSSSTNAIYSSISSKVALSSVTHISSSDVATCASTSDSIYCWGTSIYLSYGTSPTKVIGSLPSAPSQLSVAQYHACYLLTNGTAYCWGDNTDGQLGTSSSSFSTTIPTRVAISSPISSISVGYEHTCVVISGSNIIACFGNNDDYELGDGTSQSKGKVQSEMNGLTTATLLGSGSVVAGYKLTCLVRSADSGVYCIGNNLLGTMCNRLSGSSYGLSQTDYPPNNKIPIPLTSSITIALGEGGHQCATDGTTVYCWGSNFYGELGTESYSSISSCTTSSSFKKACIGSTCSSSSPSNISILPFIPLIVTSSILILTWSILIFLGCRKRQEFDAKVFLHPNGTQISGSQIWKSYTRPLGPPGTSSPISQPVSAYAIATPAEFSSAVDPVKPGYTPTVQSIAASVAAHVNIGI